MPIVYKTITRDEINSREITTLSTEKKSQVDTILNNLIIYFKDKHL